MANEADTCRKYVLPKLIQGCWDNDPHSFTEQRSFTDGRIVVAGSTVRRRLQKRADYSLMFDMNEVFERFIAAELHQALAGRPVNVQSQVRGKSLLNQNGRGRFQLRPDLGVFHGKSALCILDTKWKRLDLEKFHANVSQADMYQMYAYGKEFDSPRTVLPYPRFSSLAGIVATYAHNNGSSGPDNDQSKQIVVATIDVSAPLNSLSGRQALHRDLHKAVFGE